MSDAWHRKKTWFSFPAYCVERALNLKLAPEESGLNTFTYELCLPLVWLLSELTYKENMFLRFLPH